MAAQSESFDVAVVGGGAIGLACGHAAALRGARVVVFDAGELWGPDADPTSKVSVDAFEPYLEKA